ncbi:hypothetical protein HJC23_003874 [Cyclotella cryptica]|uniref:AAA+ ATPase domain-containing protein n=1 Tax=Cyclotella cryptica TaxID=29204 RepID=A0ABD3PNS8_9STRA|eukprot:CCRYP_013256-RA/>CCRYP_013256-RA protein AED:0.03 eAED:0.03 QI:224/0.75/0.6/1/1/1/5/0/1651
MAITTEVIDRHLASSDFCQRLIVVSIPDDEASASGNGDESPRKIWWPALKFDSFSELMSTVRSDVEESAHVKILKGMMLVSINRLKKEAGVDNVCCVAYLLGRTVVERSLILLPESDIDDIVHDFYTHSDGMADGNEELRFAAELALMRLTEAVKQVVPEHAVGAHVISSRGNKTSSSNDRDVSGGKAICSVEKSGYVPSAAGPQPKSSRIKTLRSVQQSGTLSSAKKENEKSTARNGKRGRPRKGSFPLKGKSAAESPAKGPKDVESLTGSPSPAQMSVVVKRNNSAVSPLKFSDDGESLSVATKTPRYMPIEDKTASWGVFWQDMKSKGWGYLNGDGLVSYYWVHPTCAHLKKKDLLKKCKQGEHYFTSEEAVKRYAKLHHGWEGEIDSPLSTMPDLEMVDRIKGHNRSSKVARRVRKSKSVIASMKKKRDKKGKGQLSASKKALRKANESPPSVPDETSNSGGEGFSLGEESSKESTEENKFRGKKLSYGRKRMGSLLKSTQTHDDHSSTVGTAESMPGDSSGSDTSVDPTYKVITSGDAWELLMKRFGFSYYKGKYCLPGKENKPGIESSAQEGINYFSSIEDLRKNLCAYGLPESKKALSETEEIDIERWVRYAHVTGLPDGACINERSVGEPLTIRIAWQWLQKLGLGYSNGYIIPKSNSTEKVRFERAEEFYLHLARFGIPRLDAPSASELNAHDRLRLDLFISAPGKELDTFKRITPESHEVTPRRTRNGSRTPAQFNRDDRFADEDSPMLMRKRKQPSKYAQEFAQLQQQRDLPSFVITSDKAIDLLGTHYNIHHHCSGDASYYSFTDKHSNQELSFSTLQDLRVNLCAYGLPPIAEGSNISDKEQSDLEFWIRCARMKGLHNQHASIPEFRRLDHQEAKVILKGLGYQISKEQGLFVLPGANFHNPVIGKDGWYKLIDFVNHLARFGLAESDNPDGKCTLSTEDILRFQLFVAAVATVDICTRAKFPPQVESFISKTTEYSSSLDSSNLNHTQSTVLEETITQEHCSVEEAQPAVMIENHDSPKPSPPKKPKSDQTSMLNFLTQKANDATECLTPTRPKSKLSPSEDDEEASNFSALSASCLEKGDDDVEACFVDTPSNHCSVNSNSFTPSASHLTSKACSTTQDKNKAMIDLRKTNWNSLTSQAASISADITWEGANMLDDSSLTITPRGCNDKESSPRKNLSSSPKTPANTTEANIHLLNRDSKDDEFVEMCLPDKERIVKHKLEVAQMVLHASFQGNYCSVSSMPSAITEFMFKPIQNGKPGKGLPSSGPGFLYVCGRPGTGKTTTVSQCANDIRNWAEAQGYDKPCISLVNVSSLFASAGLKDGIMKATLKQIAKKMDIEKDLSISALRKKSQKNVLILIIDEVDVLIKKRESDGENFFRELVSLASESDLRFRLIGISNSINDEYSARMKEIGSPQVLVFPSYEEKDLLAILHERLGKNVVDPKALELVARKIAATSGDARRVLEISSNAIGRCIDGMSEEELRKEVDDKNMPLVKITHMMWAIREGNAVKHADIIRRLPQLAKIVLCIAVAYGHAKGPKAEISMPQLKQFCVEATKYALFEDTDIASIMNLVEMICDAGLLRTANNSHFDPHDPDEKLKIDVQLDDVECALEESLVNGEHGGFYSGLMNYVKKSM